MRWRVEEPVPSLPEGISRRQSFGGLILPESLTFVQSGGPKTHCYLSRAFARLLIISSQ
jgi:hypothetical protein